MPKDYDQPGWVNPDWLMTGYREGGKYRIIATRKLITKEWAADFERPDSLLSTRPGYGPTMYSITFAFYEFTIVEADSYVEALEALLKKWTPDAPSEQGRQQLDSVPLALGRGGPNVE